MALSGGSNRATTLFLNASPYRAIFHPYRPQVQDHIGATTILTQGASLYALKEQLQNLWQPNSTPTAMTQRLDDWCGMAKAANIAGLNKFVKTLQSHRSAICAYADHPITTSRLEASNVSIALLRRRARGFRDMEYFKLKIFQLNTEDTPSFLYNKMPRPSRNTLVSFVGKP